MQPIVCPKPGSSPLLQAQMPSSSALSLAHTHTSPSATPRTKSSKLAPSLADMPGDWRRSKRWCRISVGGGGGGEEV